MAEGTCTYVHTEFIGSKYKKNKIKIHVHEQRMITSLVCVLKSHHPRYCNRLSELVHHWNGKRHEPAVLTGESLLNGKSKTSSISASSSTRFNRQNNCQPQVVSLFCIFCPLPVFTSLWFSLKRTILSNRGRSWASLWKDLFLRNQKISFFFIVPPENNIKPKLLLLFKKCIQV